MGIQLKINHMMGFLACLLAGGIAQADCTSPAAAAGSMDYFTSNNTSMYCNGTSWIPMKYGGISQVASVTDTATDRNSPTAAVISGNYSYIVGGTPGYKFSLMTVDVSNISNPNPVNFYSDVSLSPGMAIATDGNYLYTITQGNLKVFSISSPAAPTLVGSLSNAAINNPQRIAVSGNYVYLTASGTSSLVIINVTTKTAPSLSGSVSDPSRIGYAHALAVSGNYAYTTGSFSDTMAVIDITNKSSPSVVGNLSGTNASYSKGIAVSGNYVYIARAGSSSYEMAVIDVTTKSSPTFLKYVTNALYVQDVTISGSYLFASSGSNSLYAIDISNPASPVIAQTIAGISGVIATLGASGTQLVGVNSNIFVHFFDLSGTLQISAPGIVKAGGSAASGINLDVSGNTAVMMTGAGGAYAFNVANPSSMAYLSSISVPNTYSTGSLYDGTYAYITDVNASSVHIFNFTTPSAPTLTISFQDYVMNGPSGIAKSGNYLFVAIRTGIVIIDISSIGSPVVVGSVTNLPNNWSGAQIFVSGNYAYLTDATASALRVFDVTNKTSPSQIGVVTDGTYLQNPEGLVVSGNYAYVSNPYGGRLTVIDVTTKSSPAYLASMTTGMSGIKKLRVSGSYLYGLSMYGTGLVSVDISTPSTPTYGASVYTNAAGGLALSGTTAFASSGNFLTSGLRSLNISNPLSMSTISSVEQWGPYDSSAAVALKGNYALTIPQWAQSLAITDVSNVNNPTLVHTITNATRFNNSKSIKVSGNYAYVAAFNEMTIIDVTNPLTASIVGNLTDSDLGSPADIAVSGNYVYDLNANNLVIINATTKSAPSKVSTLTHADLTNCKRITISGSYAYATCTGTNKMLVIDVSNPASPSILGAYTFPWQPEALVVSGNYAYVAVNADMYVLNVSTPASPALVKTFFCYYCSSEVLISGSRLYFPNYDGIQTYSLANPANPKKLGGDTKNTNNVAYGRMAMTTDRMVSIGLSTLIVHSIANGAPPLEIASTVNPTHRYSGNYGNTFISGNYAYTIEQTFGRMTVTDISNPLAPSLYASYSAADLYTPNPVQFAVSGNYVYIYFPEAYTIKVFDITNPANIAFVGQSGSLFSQLNGVSKMKASGGYLYTSAATTFSVFDISVPAAPMFLNSVYGTSTSGLDISGNYAYSCDSGNGRLNVYNIATPSSPSLATTVTHASLLGCDRVVVSGSYLYTLGNSSMTFAVVDISIPAAPSFVGSYFDSAFSATRNMNVSGDYAYVSTTNGVVLIDLTTKAFPAPNDSAAMNIRYGEYVSPYLYAPGGVPGSFAVIQAQPLVTMGSCSVAGTMNYDTVNDVMTFCNGSAYIPMGATPGAGGAGCSTPTALKGSLNYNTSTNKMTYCDGTAWVPIN